MNIVKSKINPRHYGSARDRFMLLLLAVMLPMFRLAAQDNFGSRFMLGQSMEQAGQLDKAEAIYEDLYKNQPQNEVYFLAFTNLLLNVKKYAKTITLTEARMQQNPENPSLVSLLGRAYYLKGEDKKAFTIWEDFLKARGYNYQFCRVMAATASDLRIFDKTIEYLKMGKKTAPDPKSLSYEIANYQMMLMAYKDAAIELASIVKSDPQQFPTVENRLNQYLNRREAAKSFLEVFEGEFGSDINCSGLLARLYTVLGSFDKAYDLLVQLDRKQNKQGSELYNYGLQLQNAGQYQGAVKVFDYILTNYPNSQLAAVVKLSYAKALESSIEERNAAHDDWKPLVLNKPVRLEDYNFVIKSYRDISNTYRNSEPAIEGLLKVGQIYYRAGRYDSARVFLSEILKYYGMSAFYADAVFCMARIELKEDNLVNCDALYDRLLQNPALDIRKATEARYRKALILSYQNKFSEARKLLLEVSTYPKDENANDALELSMVLNTAMNDSALVVKYLAVLKMIEKNDARGADELLIALSLNKEQFFMKSISEILRVEIMIAQNRFGEAITLINEINTEKNNIFADEAEFYLGQIYQHGLKDFKNALQAYETFLGSYPSSMYCDKVREEITEIKRII